MNLRVLIVEDCIVMRSVIHKTMLLSGLSVDYVDSAENGKEGLRMIKSKNYNLILADINMPIMSGTEMISKIEKHPDLREINILIITSDLQIISTKTVGNGKYDFIQKPFTPELLRKKVLRIMKKSANIN